MVEALPTPRFGSFMRAAGKLAVARQVSALVFAAAVLALPLWVSQAWVVDFTWCYFAMLTLTSLLGLGFERLAAIVRSDRERHGSFTFSSLLLVRLATTPIAACALWVLMAFVGVSLSATAWCATLLWVMSVLMALVGFGALRAMRNSSTEPKLILAARVLQALLLVTIASGGGSLELAVGSVALVEATCAFFAVRAVGTTIRGMGAIGGAWRLPWRHALGLAGIEVVALAYLRADLLLVGRMLGAGVGATYGMIYRVIDALSTAIGSVGLWLYAESVTAGDDTAGAEELRAKSLVLLPRLALLVGTAALLPSEMIGNVAGLADKEMWALQLLIAAFPLLAVNAIELHARSGQGRNREVLRIGTVALLVNVALCLTLIPVLGLVGGALALIASETTQAALLWAWSPRSERITLARSIGVGVLGAAMLLALGSAIHGHNLFAAAAVVFLEGLLVVAPRFGRASRPVAVP